MRVAYFSEAIPPQVDGVTLTLGRLLDTLAQADVDFRILSGVVPEPTLWWRDRVHNVASVPFLPYDYYRMAVPYFQRLDRTLDAFQPDLVHCVNPTPLGLFGIAYARSRGIAAVSSYHTRFVSYFPYYGIAGLQGIAWGWLRWLYNQCAATYAPSQSAAEELRALGVREVRLWERGIDRQRFSPGHRNLELRRRIGAERTPLLLFVGRLVREKGLDDLVTALDILRSRRQPFVPVLVGDGPLRSELARRAPYLHLAGHQAGDDLARWYASADIFVFPSTTETFGNVVLEAFASGLPVVGVRASGVKDLVTPGGNGFLAPPHDPRNFADAIEGLLRNPDIRMHLREGALRTAARYDWPTVNQHLLNGYAELSRGRAA
jgi:glycosyltransferase involved in cell wall biosynthesis